MTPECPGTHGARDTLRFLIEQAPVGIATPDREMRCVTDQRYRDLVEMSPDAIFVLRREKIAFVNEAAVRLLGASRPEDLIGQLAAGRVHPDDRPAMLHTMAEMAAGRTVPAERRRLLRLDGGQCEVEVVSRGFVDQDGVAVQSIMRDVTERREAAQALDASEERFRQLAESIREVFWITDVTKARLDYISPGYETIWGRSRESLIAEPGDWMVAIHEDDRNRVMEAALTKQAAGTYDEEYRIVRPDGTVRWVRDRASPVRSRNGELLRVVGVAEDITEHRELEAQLRQTQKLESIGLLAGGVAHDFNNALTVIEGNGGLLRDLVADNPDALEFINEIRHAVDRAASLTRQLLAFSRQEVLRPEIVDLNDIVGDTERLLRRLIGEDIELRTALRSNCQVLLDAGHMSQVLMNLAVNARDAMPNGGILRLETREIELSAFSVQRFPGFSPGPYVALSVSDTGQGMTPDVLSHIFEPFFTTKERGHGTGLGLAVVHGIVQQSGGHIDVESEVGVGTTFRIVLPMVSCAVMQDGLGGEALAPGGVEHVLLVEDDADVRRITARALRKSGYSVTEATNGRHALQVLDESHDGFDLVITDVVMPELGGGAFVEGLKVKCPELRVLFISGYTDDAVVRQGIRHAEVEFLQKPFTVGALLAKVRAVLH